MHDFSAHSSIEGDTVYLTTDPVAAPVDEKDPSRCGVFPDYWEGAICYRICGEIPRGRKPKAYEFFTRRSHQGEDEPWKACSGDGCEGSDAVFNESDSRVCGNFKLWHGGAEHVDLMMKVTLE